MKGVESFKLPRRRRPQNLGRIWVRNGNTVDTGRIPVRVVCGRSNIDGGVNIIGIRGDAREGRIVVGMNYSSFFEGNQRTACLQLDRSGNKIVVRVVIPPVSGGGL
jgi:hypothetical protein